MRAFAILCALLVFASLAAAAEGPEFGRGAIRPNIILILMDDLGYGDVHALNPASKIETPNIDRLAAQGMVFTDGHTAAGVCTPARYALLTGRYSFRSRLQARILGGYDPRLIEEGRLTIASMLQQQGYTTAVIGKWHLGITFARKPGTPTPANPNTGPAPEDVDWTKPVTGGPLAVGFDYFFGIPSSIDIPPYVYIENERVLAPPTQTLTGPRGAADTFNAGLAAAGFKHVDVMPAVVAKTREYIATRGKEPTKPFFLYFAATGIHNPIVPTQEFVGHSAIPEYGDFVEQMDDSIGQIMDSLKTAGLDRDTMIIFTSDNGPNGAITDPLLGMYDHSSSAGMRGTKASLYEGGHRLPFIVSWPAQIKAGSRSAEYVGDTDILATLADITGFKLPDNAAEDSFSFAPLLRGERTSSPFRPTLVIQADAATDLALRRGPLKLITGRGGPLLYDLSTDPREVTNLAPQRPEVVMEMTAQLNAIRSSGRETPHR